MCKNQHKIRKWRQTNGEEKYKDWRSNNVQFGNWFGGDKCVPSTGIFFPSTLDRGQILKRQQEVWLDRWKESDVSSTEAARWRGSVAAGVRGERVEQCQNHTHLLFISAVPSRALNVFCSPVKENQTAKTDGGRCVLKNWAVSHFFHYTFP